MVRSRCYRGGVLVDEDFPPEQVVEHLRREPSVVWVDLCPATPEALETVSEALGLHSLAVDAAARGSQRPRFTRFAEHGFLVLYAVRLDEATGGLLVSEIAAFVTSTALVTVRADEDFDVAGLLTHWDDEADLTAHGVGALVHGLLDFVVDGHFDAVQALDDEIEQLEDLLFDNRLGDADVQRRSYAVRKSLVHLRRVVLPMREVVNTMMRREVGIVTESLTPYFQDVYDHVLRVSEWTDSLRDLVATILETNLTIQGNRLNVITKKVTSWAAIIAVPTAVTGFYGQNVPFPGFAAASGFVTSSVIMATLSIALYLTFRRNGWL